MVYKIATRYVIINRAMNVATAREIERVMKHRMRRASRW